MKVLSRKILQFQEKNFFYPIRNKLDYAKVLMHSSRLLLLERDKEQPMTQDNFKLIIEKMSRLFFYKENKFVSISYPFTVISNENEITEIVSYSGIKVSFEIISFIIATLNDEQFRLKPSPIDIWVETEGNDLIGLSLLEEIFSFEPSYIRYDIDSQNENGKRHPLNHFDINYSQYGTYKIGLENNILENYFEDFLNTTTDCSFISR